MLSNKSSFLWGFAAVTMLVATAMLYLIEREIRIGPLIFAALFAGIALIRRPSAPTDGP